MIPGVEFCEDKNDATKILVSRVPACFISKEVAQMKNNKTHAMVQLVKVCRDIICRHTFDACYSTVKTTHTQNHLLLPLCNYCFVLF